MRDVDHDFLAPLFLGSCGENNDYVERLLVSFFRDHVFWRRNFHPEDPPSVTAMEQHREQFVQKVAHIEQELYRLSANLKKSAPFFAPRYIGHMASDLLTPGLLAQLVTVLYNPNNVSSEAAPVTLDLEIEVGRQLATMFGMRVDPDGHNGAWGHITSGGTVANYEALWFHRAIKLFPSALALSLGDELELEWTGRSGQSLAQLDAWQLLNLSMGDCCDLYHALQSALKDLPPDRRQGLNDAVNNHRFEHLGLADFLQHHGYRMPAVIVPSTAHYSWKKSCGLFGYGTRNLWKVATDRKMRMDACALADTLDRALSEGRSVLAIIGVLGTTEFGTIDPIEQLLEVRNEFAERGLYAPIHVDAAWGGYLSTLIRNPDGSTVEHREVKERFKYFPSKHVYGAFEALSRVESITVDPHKLGYLPFGAGAFVGSDQRMTEFVGQRPAYIYDEASAIDQSDRLQQLGDYILEGSKPGAAAAAASVTHRVLPLNKNQFGKLLAQTIRASEYFFDRIQELNEELEDYCRILAPIRPDTNLICLVMNPRQNQTLAGMNRFGRSVFGTMAVDTHLPLQTREFIGSYTSIFRRDMSDQAAAELCERIGVDPTTFTEDMLDLDTQSDHIFVLRHTLMNPWLTHRKDGGPNYIDRYCEFLEEIVRDKS